MKIICSADECVGLLCFFLVAHAHCNGRKCSVADFRFAGERLIADLTSRNGQLRVVDLRHIVEQDVHLTVAGSYAHRVQLIRRKIVYERSALYFRRRSVHSLIEGHFLFGKVHGDVGIVVLVLIPEDVGRKKRARRNCLKRTRPGC